MNIPIVTPVINWRNVTTKSGVYPIHLRIYIAGQSCKYYPVQVPAKVPLSLWTGKDGTWVDNRHPFAFEINNRINELKTKINELIRRFYLQNRPLTFYTIEREIFRKGDRTLLNDYFRNYIDHPPATVSLDPVTWEKYEAFLTHLNAFNPKIRFSDLDGTMIARIKNHLATRKGRRGKLEPATIKSYFDKFKVMLSYAAKKDHLLDPREIEGYFEEVHISVPKKKEGQHLEIEDLQKLRKLTFEGKPDSLARDRDIFLFQVYTGFYYNDLKSLKKDQLFNDVQHGYYIIGERDKNGQPTIIPLFKFPYAATILDRYRDTGGEHDFLFRRKVFIEVQVYNRNLKLLGKMAGIPRKISNKTGRHTNAQMWIRFGAERPVLSRMLGHEAEHTTENYYRVNLREIIEGTKAVDFERYAI